MGMLLFLLALGLVFIFASRYLIGDRRPLNLQGANRLVKSILVTAGVAFIIAGVVNTSMLISRRSDAKRIGRSHRRGGRRGRATSGGGITIATKNSFTG